MWTEIMQPLTSNDEIELSHCVHSAQINILSYKFSKNKWKAERKWTWTLNTAAPGKFLHRSLWWESKTQAPIVFKQKIQTPLGMQFAHSIKITPCFHSRAKCHKTIVGLYSY